ncbi:MULTISPECIES: hypothetical protein [unclassified Pseudomonas]|uniref:hypothetical protein n=1 Tax=unclassified Pseudomonas TaxID=196821 RepID=UPI0015B6A073|nr:MULTISPECIES: hypothetical protein [unclassified Pseudomonas]
MLERAPEQCPLDGIGMQADLVAIEFRRFELTPTQFIVIPAYRNRMCMGSWQRCMPSVPHENRAISANVEIGRIGEILTYFTKLTNFSKR